MRPTKERLEEIRKYASENEVSKEIHDLLSEINALTVDINRVNDKASQQLDELREEKDKACGGFDFSNRLRIKAEEKSDLFRSQLKTSVELIAELVRLKDLKDTQGKSMEYEVQKLKAWKEAREALSGVFETTTDPKDAKKFVLWLPVQSGKSFNQPLTCTKGVEE